MSVGTDKMSILMGMLVCIHIMSIRSYDYVGMYRHSIDTYDHNGMSG